MKQPRSQSTIRRGDGIVVSVGECMVELARGGDGRFGLAYGGDTFNTAAYLARCGVPVAYATAVGDDPYSAAIIELARAEAVATHLIGVLPGRMPGLYMIETSQSGERSFWYWRDRAAARDLFDSAAAEAVSAAMGQARLIYFSGITLSIYSPPALDRFAAVVGQARANGATIAMDNNFRPRGWGGDLDRARATFERFWRLADIALPTFDDEQALWGDPTTADAIARLRALGPTEIVVKCGASGAVVHAARTSEEVPCPERISPVDTTAAGDSFNAGYLARRLAGAAPPDAARFGHRLAGVVIQHRGAIVPKAATSAVTGS